MYSIIFNILSSKFTFVENDDKSYFYDRNGAVVATVTDNAITMFYSFPECSHEIWNHEGKVAITFVKDFNVNDKVCDIFYIHGLCGACNDIEVVKDFAIDTVPNYNMGKKDPRQEFIDNLSNEEKIKLFEKATGCIATGANLEGAHFFGKKPELGNCGKLVSKNGYADFDICGIITIKNCKVSGYGDRYREENSKNQSINLVKYSYTKETDYKEIIEYYMKKYKWNYTVGINNAGTPDVMRFVNERRYSTINKRGINSQLEIVLSKQFYKGVYDEDLKIVVARIKEIYRKYETRSLNSINLEILTKLKQYIEEFKEKFNCATICRSNPKDLIPKELEFNKTKPQLRKKKSK